MKLVSSLFSLFAFASPAAAAEEPLEVTVALIAPQAGARVPVFEAKAQLAQAGACSKVQASAPDTTHELTVCRRGGTDLRPVLQLELTRFVRGDKDDRRHVEMTVALTSGKRVVVGKIANTGGVLEVEAQIDVAR